MRAKVAVATVQGKAYFLIVNELKQRNIPFLSLIPGDSVPDQVRAVITTEKEKHLTPHNKILVYDTKTEPEVLGSKVLKILLGKEEYANIVIGVDPGEVFGLAVIADEAVIDTENCFKIEETLNKVNSVLKTVNFSRSTVTVKIGNGVPVYRELLEALDEALSPHVSLEIVGEAGTNRFTREVKNRRGLRHMVSAMHIARRAGYRYSRRKTAIEQDS
jgi:hypothetical protein